MMRYVRVHAIVSFSSIFSIHFLVLDTTPSHTTTVIIVDEAQSLYDTETTKSEPLWHVVKKIYQLPSRSPLQIILFASYGSPSATSSTARTPFRFPPTSVVGLRERTVRGVTNPGLYRTRNDEFHELMSSFQGKSKMSFGDAVKNYIFEITCGHVGQITLILNWLYCVGDVSVVGRFYTASWTGTFGLLMRSRGLVYLLAIYIYAICSILRILIY